MNESSKTNAIRGNDFSSTYFSGRVLDIGAGKDPVCSSAIVFDQQHGDANHIRNYFESNSFDTVHSSHCLEHMNNPIDALSEWWSLVKPGGYLVTVVPHEELYEQGLWPSFFNDDHKSSFRLNSSKPLSDFSYDIAQMHLALPDAHLISTEIHDTHLKRELLFKHGSNPRRLKHPLKLVMSILKRLTNPDSPIRYQFIKWLVQRGYPFDQTTGSALAQIQVIIQKIKP